ncbi:MAG: xanthine dehydrogenase family protein subunit M [Gemmatimonadetes bacterium]|nr:xanthine dehydrogenase family protein subunit M [Gemmatimonadota bacterium]
MKPAPFTYHRPATVEEALALLAEHGGEAKPLAGGQSLIPAMNFRLARPAVLVDLNRIGELAYVKPADRRAGESADGDLRIGAMTRQRVAERNDLIAEAAPLLRETMPFIAHPQIRNRGTIGGSLAHADPAAELPAVMLVLDARFQVRNRRGSRWVPAGEFYTGLFTTALAPDELLVEIAIPPRPTNSGWAFMEVARRHGDYALAGVAVVVELDNGGRCRAARIALFSVGEGPVLARRAAKAVVGEAPTVEVARAAADAAASKDVDPPGDIHASAAYRRQLVGTLTRRALERAFERAGARGRA